jgi:hypothetical protein
MELLSIVRDGGGHPLLDRGSEVGTVVFSGVDNTGTALTLPCDCKEILMICSGGAESWQIAGTIDSATTKVTIPSDYLILPICGEEGDEPLTLYAVSADVNISVILFR